MRLTMKARDALIAWTPATSENSPTAGRVKVGRLLERNDPDWTKPYERTGGAAYAATRRLDGDASALALFIDFHTLVVRDDIEPAIAHEAFLVIDEYREFIAPDIPGASDDDIPF
jgi:hypothetical protein